MIMGTASLVLTTPLATKPTMTEVETEEDWTKTVAKSPTKSPPMGFETPLNKPSTRSLPRLLNPPPSNSTPVRNKYKRAITRSALTNVGIPRSFEFSELRAGEEFVTRFLNQI